MNDQNQPTAHRAILFICTGNYYRSRYAEMYFNAQASKLNLDWQAMSRGLAIDFNNGNIGPIAPRVLVRLAENGMAFQGNIRSPIKLTENDLGEANLTIALFEPEHRPLMQRRFPEWENRITYWQVPDLDLLPSNQAFSIIEQNVSDLISKLNLFEK